MDPKLILAVDNCFAYKRWVKPCDWMRVIRDMGLYYVEQSADTECDPLYMGAEYMKEWAADVRRESGRTGVRVANVYSGHGTYTTCGLTHWHDGVRLRFREQWMKPQADTARAVDAGFGFFAHGLDQNMLQSREVYEERVALLCEDLAELAAYGQRIGLKSIGLEQMYTPHMPPWTIRGTEELIRTVWKRAGAPMYITLDVGHMNGQQYFLRPTPEEIRRCVTEGRPGETPRQPWLGSEAAYAIRRQAAAGAIPADEAVARILEDIDAHPHLFAEPEDGDIWTWTRALARWSPIVHLQQSDGKTSPHWPFSAAYNERGVVTGEKVIRALADGFRAEAGPDMPPDTEEIVLTLEPFVGTAANPYTAVDEIAESVAYWRRFVPRDGMRLSEAEALLP